MVKNILAAALAVIFSLTIVRLPAYTGALYNEGRTEPRDEYAAASLPLSGRVIILDAGHGLGSDNVWMDYSEQETMLKLAFKIKPMLEELGAIVHMTRHTPENVILHARAAYINKLALLAIRDTRYTQADIAEIDRLLNIIQKIIDNPEYYAPIYMNAPFDRTYTRRIHPDMEIIFDLQNHPHIYQRFLAISLHSNATERPVNTEMHGADVFIASNTRINFYNYYNRYANIERSRLFADLLLDRIDYLGIERRSILDDNAFLMIREHNIPAVLVENGFHTNPYDRAKLQDDEFLKDLARAYVSAIVEYFAFFSHSPETANTFINWRFNAYASPDFTAERVRAFYPQHVVIKEKQDDGWAMICTYLGGLWVYPDRNLRFIGRRMGVYYNKTDFRPAWILESEIVYVTGQTGDWLQICTWLGKKWLNLSSVYLDVPIFNQRYLGYPTGCETVALAMMMNYTVDVCVHTLFAQIPYNRNPRLGFRGDPTTPNGFTILPQALEAVTKKHMGSVHNMTGGTIDDLKAKLYANAPVVVWIVGFGWNVHALCLTGFNQHGFFYNDPWTGVKDDFITYDEFFAMWNTSIRDRLLNVNYSPRKALSYFP